MNALYLHCPRICRMLLTISACWLFTGASTAQVFMQLTDSVRDYRILTQSFVKRPGGYRVLGQQVYMTNVLKGFRYDADEAGIMQDSEYVTLPGTINYINLLILSRNGDLINLAHRALTRFSFSGDTLWSISFPDVSADGWALYYEKGVREDKYGTIFINFYGFHGLEAGQIIYKIAPDGQVLTRFFIPVDKIDFSYEFRSVIPAGDGGCVAYVRLLLDTQQDDDTTKLCRLGPAGNLKWSYPLGPKEGFVATTVTSNDNVMFERYRYDSLTKSHRFSIWRLDQLGAPSLLFDLDSLFAVPKSYYYSSGVFIPCQNGDVVYSIQFTDNTGVNRIVMMRFSTTGQLRWLEFPGVFNNQPGGPPYFQDGMELDDGSLVFLGRWHGKSLLYKIRPDGTPTRISGTVASDQNVDCALNAGEMPIEKAWIEISDGSFTYLHRSDNLGQYHAKVDTGTYTVKVYPPSYLWEACDTMLTVSVPDTGMLAVADFPLQAMAECPVMTVDVVSSVLRRCAPSIYYVHYCNIGSQPADSAVITIDLDTGLIFQSSTVPALADGQLLTFLLGAVTPGQCGAFQFTVMPDCNTVPTGATKCVTAHIFPDSICGDPPPGWGGATIEVSATCAGDSVVFVIYNTGSGPMSNPLEYVIIDDHVIMRSGSYWLGPGDSMRISIKADGTPLRLIATQEPGHPAAQTPSIGVEGCGSAIPELFTGFMNTFPNTNGSTFEATLCREVVGSYDPNDKSALPTGFSSGHWIFPETELDYLIRFQNEGTDTAFRVILLDTLSEQLNPVTLQAEMGSHPFRMELYAGNVVAFIFDGINLPSLKTNEAGSQGWARFKIKPRAGLPEGTLLKNRAGIYFDYNEPVLTNTVFHRVGRRFWAVDAQQEKPDQPEDRLRLWPNPATDRVFFHLDAPVLTGTFYRLSDLYGRCLLKQAASGPESAVPCGGLAEGLYFLEVWDRRGKVAGGVVVVQRY